MLDKEQLEKKIIEEFKKGDRLDALRKWVWEYANKCWTDGYNYGKEKGFD